MGQSQLVTGNVLGGAVNDNLTRFLVMSGNLGFVTNAEERVELPIRDAGTASNLFVYVSTNTVSANTTVTVRKSRVDTAITVTYASDETGIKEDTANTATFAATDEIDIEVATGTEAGTNTITFTAMGLSYTPSSNTISIAEHLSEATAPVNNTTYFFPPGGVTVSAFTATEANCQYRVRQAFTAQDFYTFMTSNARTTNLTVKTRKNGADGAQSVVYTSGQTGAKEDTANTDSLAVGDDYNYAVTGGTDTGNIQVPQVSSTLLSTNNSFHLIVADDAGYGVGFNQNQLMPLGGRLRGTATEALTQVTTQFAWTASELGAYASANTILVSDSTVTFRLNGANSPVTVAYATLQTGLKNDSVNTAAVSAGDEINAIVSTPNSSGTLTLTWIAITGATAVVAGVLRPFHFCVMGVQ